MHHDLSDLLTMNHDPSDLRSLIRIISKEHTQNVVYKLPVSMKNFRGKLEDGL